MEPEIGDLHTRAGGFDSAAMILTCPECATRYFIDDAAIGAAGRQVRCSFCATAWRVTARDEPLDLVSSSEEGAVAKAPEADEPFGAFGTLSDLPGEKLPQAFRAKAQLQRRIREAAASGAIWAGMATAFVVLLGASAIYRADVVRVWPKAASAYAAVGLPVNTTGLVIEQVKAAPTLQNGRAAVVVSGVLRNIQRSAATTPPLRVSLLDKTGKPVQAKIATPAQAQIPAGQSRHFSVGLFDPPKTASDVEVSFILPKTAPRPAAAEPPPPRLRLSQAPPPRPLKAEDAKPLPAASPYALPQAGDAAPPAPRG